MEKIVDQKTRLRDLMRKRREERSMEGGKTDVKKPAVVKVGGVGALVAYDDEEEEDEDEDDEDEGGGEKLPEDFFDENVTSKAKEKMEAAENKERDIEAELEAELEALEETIEQETAKMEDEKEEAEDRDLELEDKQEEEEQRDARKRAEQLRATVARVGVKRPRSETKPHEEGNIIGGEIHVSQTKGKDIDGLSGIKTIPQTTTHHRRTHSDDANSIDLEEEEKDTDDDLGWRCKRIK